MSFESPDMAKDFPGLYRPPGIGTEGHFDEEGRPIRKKEVVVKRRDSRPERRGKGYRMFEEEDSEEELVAEDTTKSPSKMKKHSKPSFKFAKREKFYKPKEKDKDRDLHQVAALQQGHERDKYVDKHEKGDGHKEGKKKDEKLKWRKRKMLGPGASDNLPKAELTDKGASGKDLRPIFGVPLALAVDRNRCHDGIQLPIIFRECVDYIEEFGLGCEGIYRMSGVKSKVAALKDQYNLHLNVNLHEQEPNIIASLLKLFLRELPEPVLTKELMPKFEEASTQKNVKQKVEMFRQVIEQLPVPNKLLLSWMIVHMTHVIAREKQNKMSLQNVSIVLSPTMQISHRVLNVLFTYARILFKDTIIKRYVPALKPQVSKWSLDLPESPSSLEEELLKQESLLSQLHEDVMKHNDKNKEEQLWEVQRVVTQLKRKIKLMKKTQKTESAKEREIVEQKQEKQQEKAQQPEQKLPQLEEKPEKTDEITVVSQAVVDEPDGADSVPKPPPEASGGEDLNMEVTVASAETVRPGTEGEQVNDDASGQNVDTQEEQTTAMEITKEVEGEVVHPAAGDGDIRTDDQKMHSNDEKVHSDEQKIHSDDQKVQLNDQEAQASEQKMKSDDLNMPSDTQKMQSDEKAMQYDDQKMPSDDDLTPTEHSEGFSEKLPETQPDSATSSNIDIHQAEPLADTPDTPQVEAPAELFPAPAEFEGGKVEEAMDEEVPMEPPGTSAPGSSAPGTSAPGTSSLSVASASSEEADQDNWRPMSQSGTDTEQTMPKLSVDELPPVYTDSDSDTDVEPLQLQYNKLLLEEEELLALGDELKQKIETEQSEIGRLHQEIDELKSIREDLYDSEDPSSDSSDEADDEEDLQEILRELTLKNQQLEEENQDLSTKLQQERRVCLDVKVQIRMIQQRQLESSGGMLLMDGISVTESNALIEALL